MATIISVHGTGNTGPPNADRSGQGEWWQKSGYFDRHLVELVSAEASDLKFEPLVWSGANSETARWAAGRELYALCRRLDAAREPYVVVGHSHGGSVIRHCLEFATSKKQALPGLSAWITVGTPFIESRASYFLVNRLSIWGKSAYIICVLFILWIFLSFLAFYDPGAGVRAAGLAKLAILFVPAMVLYMTLRLIVPRKVRLFRKDRLRTKIRNAYSHRWLAIYHRDDEAMQGLGMLSRLAISPLDQKFAASTILLVLFVGLVGLIPVIALSEEMSKDIIVAASRWLHMPGSGNVNELSAFLKSINPPIDLSLFLQRTMVLGALVFACPVVAADAVGLTFLLPQWNQLAPVPLLASLAALFVIALFAVWAMVNVVVLVLSSVAAGISSVLSKMINALIRSGVRRSGYGSDFQGENGIRSGAAPPWLDEPPPLPAELSEEIAQLSNEAAARSVSKFRGMAAELITLDKVSDAEEAVNKYLTWHELIHTSYFLVPRVRKLIAYAIVQSPGFKPTEAFNADPELDTVARWYQEIRQVA